MTSFLRLETPEEGTPRRRLLVIQPLVGIGDMVWHKPTQSFSSSDNFFKVLWNNTLKDEFDKEKLKSDFNHMGQFRYNHKDIKAFEILGISVGSGWGKIYDKFKILVKKFHPDMNSGNKKFEEKLKSITLAYTQLKNTYREKN